MRSVLFTCLFIITTGTLNAQSWNDFRFETGDLLFQDLDCGEVCNALRKVTPATGSRHYTHVGMAYVAGDSVWVLEAYGQDVHLISLSRFLQRQLDGKGRPKVSVGRVNASHQGLNGRAAGFMLQKRGTPYDHDFTAGNEKFYSSELIAEAFKDANGGKPLFDPEPMSFNDPGANKTHPLWKRYFDEIGVEVPEGKSSISPAALANDEVVEMVASFY